MYEPPPIFAGRILALRNRLFVCPEFEATRSEAVAGVAATMHIRSCNWSCVSAQRNVSRSSETADCDVKCGG